MKNIWTKLPTIKCKDAQKQNLCPDCFYYFLCYPKEAPDKEYSQPYTAYDDQP